MRRLLIALVVLAGLLVAADRVGVVLAERAMADQLRAELALQRTPDVSIRGIPFLTQAVRGRYREVRVVLPDVDTDELQNLAVNARLFGVRIPLGDVLRGRVDAVPVDRINGELTVGYDDLARASGIAGLRIVRDGDALRVSGRVEVLGQQVDASAVTRVEAAGNDIVVTAEEVRVESVELPAPALAAAGRLLSFRVSPRNLPLDLRITGVRSGDQTLVVTAESDALVLRR